VQFFRRFLLFVLSLVLASCAHAQRYVEREFLIPMGMAFPNGLDAMLVYADLPGKHPLVVLTHGTSRKPEERAEVTVWQLTRFHSCLGYFK
jgi:hypothetical protein